jgi:hypothetical protein
MARTAKELAYRRNRKAKEVTKMKPVVSKQTAIQEGLSYRTYSDICNEYADVVSWLNLSSVKLNFSRIMTNWEIIAPSWSDFSDLDGELFLSRAFSLIREFLFSIKNNRNRIVCTVREAVEKVLQNSYSSVHYKNPDLFGQYIDLYPEIGDSIAYSIADKKAMDYKHTYLHFTQDQVNLILEILDKKYPGAMGKLVYSGDRFEENDPVDYTLHSIVNRALLSLTCLNALDSSDLKRLIHQYTFPETIYFNFYAGEKKETTDTFKLFGCFLIHDCIFNIHNGDEDFLKVVSLDSYTSLPIDPAVLFRDPGGVDTSWADFRYLWNGGYLDLFPVVNSRRNKDYWTPGGYNPAPIKYFIENIVSNISATAGILDEFNKNLDQVLALGPEKAIGKSFTNDISLVEIEYRKESHQGEDGICSISATCDLSLVLVRDYLRSLGMTSCLEPHPEDVVRGFKFVSGVVTLCPDGKKNFEALCPKAISQKRLPNGNELRALKKNYYTLLDRRHGQSTERVIVSYLYSNTLYGSPLFSDTIYTQLDGQTADLWGKISVLKDSIGRAFWKFYRDTEYFASLWRDGWATVSSSEFPAIASWLKYFDKLTRSNKQELQVELGFLSTLSDMVHEEAYRFAILRDAIFCKSVEYTKSIVKNLPNLIAAFNKLIVKFAPVNIKACPPAFNSPCGEIEFVQAVSFSTLQSASRQINKQYNSWFCVSDGNYSNNYNVDHTGYVGYVNDEPMAILIANSVGVLDYGYGNRNRHGGKDEEFHSNFHSIVFERQQNDSSLLPSAASLPFDISDKDSKIIIEEMLQVLKASRDSLALIKKEFNHIYSYLLAEYMKRAEELAKCIAACRADNRW